MKNSSEEKSLPKNEETSPATKLQTIMTRNIKKIRTGEISGKNALLNFNFHSWQLFLIEISFGWTFWVEILLQILFARGFSDFGWLRSLFRYLGRMLASNIFWVLLLLPHQQHPTTIAFKTCK